MDDKKKEGNKMDETVLPMMLIDGSKALLIENDRTKHLSSEKYSFVFDKKTGMHIRWGKTKEDDGDLEIGLPEIADIEISTICSGVEGIGVCKFCYKSNTPNGEYMSLDTFKKLFGKLPRTITQIALGIGNLNFEGTETMFQIMDHCRKNGVIPNVTVNGDGMTDEIANKLVEKCGAIACSVYDKDKTFDTIKKLTGLGLDQCNIHFMLSEETADNAIDLLDDIKNDPRLAKLNAVVFLSLKSKGRATNGYTKISEDKFTILCNKAFDKNVQIGFDSCTAFKFLKYCKKHKPDLYAQIEPSVEPCESSIYSSYINTQAHYFPCSFIEGTPGWEEGIDVLKSDHFLKDVWYHDKTNEFRNDVLQCRSECKACPVYDI